MCAFAKIRTAMARLKTDKIINSTSSLKERTQEKRGIHHSGHLVSGEWFENSAV